MNSATLPVVVALSIQFLLGLIVFQSNWQRRANQAFLLLSIITAGWLGCLYFAIGTRNMRIAELAIREASLFGGLILLALNVLRVALTERHPTWAQIFRRNLLWFVLSAAVAVFCQTRFFLRGIQLSDSTGAIMPLYARYAPLYFACFVGCGLAVIVSYIRDAKRATAGKKTELTFILIGAAVAVGSTVLSFILGL